MDEEAKRGEGAKEEKIGGMDEEGEEEGGEEDDNES